MIGIEGYVPSQTWSPAAATTQLNLVLLEDIPPFPTLQELDNNFDGWPELGNPFVNWDPVTPAEPIDDGICVLPTLIRIKAVIVIDLIRSDDKLYYIAYSQERSQKQKE